MTINRETITHLINEDKKEVERLENRRQEDLGNSINYIENELQLQHLLGRIEGLETLLGKI
ncbi:hypothetical protein [Vagococcus xieshaowenii]|uniref:Uncharacterized protein n=1 Tax=Vagococcus xieshaowenii TaxID=2562451 RepID=A0AAJ5JLN7_9ENTE|nr:hypothetical protein [Vagococcus xieshaowenii]QCA28759.1 hypothetical protein E4Z98_05305 [Vagococcus xieshaowenii]TFZ43039.1 hypothetical protein E4031_01340 [Vagococcus xieshaowenii]